MAAKRVSVEPYGAMGRQAKRGGKVLVATAARPVGGVDAPNQGATDCRPSGFEAVKYKAIKSKTRYGKEPENNGPPAVGGGGCGAYVRLRAEGDGNGI